MVNTAVGGTLGEYKIVAHIGHGGMSEVYKAIRLGTGQIVALKVLHHFHARDSQLLKRFRREATAMSKLYHRHIVGIYDFDAEGEVPYIAMQFVGGGTLKSRLRRLSLEDRMLPIEESLRIIIEISDALAYAHANDIVHRDIKPANILFDDDGNAILSDFGIVKQLNGTTYTATGAMIGTPAYMSPEQGLGHPGDTRSDIYALGVMLYQLITGRLPFDATKPLAVVLKHINDPVPYPSKINAHIPDGVEEAVMKSMQKDPENRYQSAQEMANQLRRIILDSDQTWARGFPVHLLVIKRVARQAALIDVPEPQPEVASPTNKPVSRGANAAHETPLRPFRRSAPVPQRRQAEIYASAEPATQQPLPPRKPRPWLVIGLLLLAGLCGLVTTASTQFTPVGRGDDTYPIFDIQPTRTGESQAEAASTETAPIPTPTLVAIATNTPRPSPTPFPTETVTIEPTEPTATPLPTETVEPTAAIIVPDVACDEPFQVELVNAYTYHSATNYVPVGQIFEMHWVLRNNGHCALPANIIIRYESGNPLGQTGDVFVADVLHSDEQITVITTLQSPSEIGAHLSSWYLVDEDGERIGSPFSFVIRTYDPATTAPGST